VTSHGFALNIDPDLSVFDSFVAGSLSDVTMTSLSRLAAEQGSGLPSETEVRDAVARNLLRSSSGVGA
jgi:lipoyl(octanoyl) transferase